jgi:hypothetical protein
MASEFEMKGIGMMHYFLGLEVWQRPREVFLEQGKDAIEILKRFQMDDCKPMATPMINNLKKMIASNSKSVDPTLYKQPIGSLMYLVNTRPNICVAMNTLSRFMVEPRKEHWVAAKHVLKYLRGIVEYDLRYREDDEAKFQGNLDSDWAGNAVIRKSTSKCCFSLGSTMIY